MRWEKSEHPPVLGTTTAVYRIRTQRQSGGDGVSISGFYKSVGTDRPHPLNSHRKIQELKADRKLPSLSI